MHFLCTHIFEIESNIAMSVDCDVVVIAGRLECMENEKR